MDIETITVDELRKFVRDFIVQNSNARLKLLFGGAGTDANFVIMMPPPMRSFRVISPISNDRLHSFYLLHILRREWGGALNKLSEPRILSVVARTICGSFLITITRHQVTRVVYDPND